MGFLFGDSGVATSNMTIPEPNQAKLASGDADRSYYVRNQQQEQEQVKQQEQVDQQEDFKRELGLDLPGIPEAPDAIIVDTPIKFNAGELGKIEPSDDKKKKLKVLRKGLDQLKIPLDVNTINTNPTPINV